MKTTILLLAAACAAYSTAASAQGSGSYEPQMRMRTALDTCMSNEVMKEAYCVRKCAPDFRMDLSGKKAVCIPTKVGAKPEVPSPGYVKPKLDPSRPTPPGA